MVKTKIEKAAFIGLGAMGYPMAGHLAKSGFSVMVYNRTKSKADRWVSEFGGRAAATPREAASGADIVFLCVGNDNDVRSVVYGEDGALAGMTPGAILWDDTTDSAQLARELYKAAKEKGAYSFYIVRQVDANQGGNQRITAFIYKEDAKKRVLQSPDAIPANSEAGRAAIAKGGEEAKKVEIPGVATTATPSAEVGRFFETQSTKGGRYSVTLPDGTKVEELNNATAAQMVPFDSIKFTGNYGNMTEVSYQVAKRAAKKKVAE